MVPIAQRFVASPPGPSGRWLIIHKRNGKYAPEMPLDDAAMLPLLAGALEYGGCTLRAPGTYDASAHTAIAHLVFARALCMCCSPYRQSCCCCCCCDH